MSQPDNTVNILTVKVPVPVPEIKQFSRWQVFKALFNPRAHFTTCESLKHQLTRETEVTTKHALEGYNWKDNYV
jgi:hypothetical protein